MLSGSRQRRSPRTARRTCHAVTAIILLFVLVCEGGVPLRGPATTAPVYPPHAADAAAPALVTGTEATAPVQLPDGWAAGTAREIREGPLLLRVVGVDDANWLDLSTLLQDQLTLAGDVAPSAPLADDLAFFARSHYIRTGWPEAQVRWELQPDAILLLVDAGYQVRVGEITWSGDIIVPTDELRQFLLKVSLEKDGADKNHPLWVDNELTTGVSFVQRRMRAEGHLQAKVSMTPAPEPKPNGHRDIAMHIEAGPRFIFGDVILHGAPPELESTLQATIQQSPGSPFSEASVQSMERRLMSIASSNGYLDARAASDYTMGKRGGTVDVVLNLDSGRKMLIARVSPHPDFSKGAKRVLRSGFRLAEGNFYSSESLDLMFRRALDTGIFQRLDMEPAILPWVGPDNIGYAELFLTGEETKPHTVGFEIGFDTFLGPQIGVTYRNPNFRDTGNSLAAELRMSGAGPLGSIKYTDPAILGSLYSSTVQLAVETFDRFEYVRLGSSLSIELVRRVSVPFSYTVFAGIYDNTVSSDALSLRELGPTAYTLASAGASMILDFRDSPVLPTKGWYLSARFESTMDAASSDLSFTRTDLRGAFYHPFTDKLRFATRAGLFSVQGATVEELPIDLRVFNGGANSIRSFSEREMGAKSPGGTPLGGTAAFFASVEFTYEIFKNFDVAVFSDVGSLDGREQSNPFRYSDDVRVAAGVGLRYRLPFGPIRIDYGHNLNPKFNDPSGTLHVTLGFAF